MQDSKALPIFSPKKISTVVNFIKKERPDLWDLWKSLEESDNEDLYRKTVNEIIDLIRPQSWTKTLNERTELMWSVRNVLRSERSLPIVNTSFTKEKIASSVSYIKKSRPELWETWKNYEKNDQSYQPIRTEIIDLLQEMEIAKNSLEMQSLLTVIRHVVLADSGIWEPDEI
jgi:hypothetical protein